MPPKQAVQSTIYNGATVEVIVGDMTAFPVDAIVNAANTSLRGGGGIDAAIHAAAGPGLLAELTARFPGGAVGGAYTTGAHNIQTARHIIHAIGPNYGLIGGNLAAQSLAHQQLYNAYTNSLLEAVNVGARSIAIPTISSGIYAFPRHQATNIALGAVRTFLDGIGKGNIDRVVFLVLGEEDFIAYNALFQNSFPELEDESEEDFMEESVGEYNFQQEEHQDEEEHEDDVQDGQNEDTDGPGDSVDGQKSSHGGDEGRHVSASDYSCNHSAVDLAPREDGNDCRGSSENGDEKTPLSLASDHLSDHLSDHSSVHSSLDLTADDPSLDPDSSDEDYNNTNAEEDSSEENLSEAISDSTDRAYLRTPSPPPYAPPGPAPRPRTCGANGGITKNGNPCGNAPIAGSLRCRHHQNP